MTKRMLIDAMHPEETRVVIVDGKQIIDFDFISSAKKQVKGNIYLAKITRVEPSLQAAFVEYGGGKQGFLPFAEIHADYYQIPAADRKRLMEEAAREAAEEEGGEGENETPAATDDANGSNEPETEAAASSYEPIALPTLQEIAPLPELPEGDDAAALDAQTPSVGEAVSEDMEEPAEAPSEGGADAAENVETIAPEEEEARQERKKRNFFKRYKIQEVIRRGQIVLVQVIKEERGNKGASLTTYLSLPGRYCVLMPNSPKDGGISRKISSAEDRKRLKAISTELRLAEGMSVIIRTAGMERPRAEIKRDFDYLVKLWNHIREVTLQSTAPALIYEESDVIKRAIRDQYKNDVDDIIVQGQEGYEAAHEFMKLLLPSHTSKVKLHDESIPLFYAYDIEDQLMSMHDPVVKLKSGGYIVINPTEALISIDVNSGRSTGERNIEETAYKTNMEAAAEVGRQLRLRDLAGLIVIDFIDMLESRNRRAVEKVMKDVLKADRAKIQIGRISPFGLLEMSRQRLRPSISETSMVQCPHCEGRGYIRSNESMAIQIIRSLEKEAATGNWGQLRLIAPQNVALHLLNSQRDMLRSMEERHNVVIQILIDVNLTASEFNMEKMRRAGTERGERGDRHDRSDRNDRNDRGNRRGADRSRAVDTTAIAAEVAENNYGDVEEVGDESSGNVTERVGEDGKTRERSRRGRRGGRNRNNRDRNNRDRVPQEAQNDNAGDAETSGAAQSEAAENNPEGEGNARPDRPRRSRGGRGRNRWKERDGEPREHSRNDRNDNPEAPSDNVVAFDKPEPRAPREETPAPLPAFTQRAAVEPPPVQQVANLHGETPRDPNAQSKKGWWQRMINLDE
ncbi:MAG: ribonuclease E/G [Alphaproteobacteria bacterium]|nr:ribonuclease E/G [Alphaproteobacteria bacterium]